MVQALMLQFDKDCPGYNEKEGHTVCYKAVVRQLSAPVRATPANLIALLGFRHAGR